MDLQYGALFKIDEVKAAEGGWSCSGYCSTFGNVDHVGDVVMRGAFDASLAAWKGGTQKIRFLNAHRQDQVLGKPTDFRTDDNGLLGTFKISQTTLGQDIHTLLKDGALDSFSIGYLPTEVEFDDVGVRKLMAIDLMEVSVVAIPANDKASITAVKGLFPDLLAQIKRHLLQGTQEAERLAQLAGTDELDAGHLAAIRELYDETKASSARLEALLPVSRVDPGLDSLKVRFDLARARARRLGVEVAA